MSVVESVERGRDLKGGGLARYRLGFPLVLNKKMQNYEVVGGTVIISTF